MYNVKSERYIVSNIDLNEDEKCPRFCIGPWLSFLLPELRNEYLFKLN